MEVQLRPLRLEDWQAVHSWARLEQACRYQSWGPNTTSQTRAFVEAGVLAWSTSPQQRLVHAVQVDGVVLGLGEVNLRSVDRRHGEIAYAVHPDRWGEGIATRVGRRLIQVGFAGFNLHRIFATCDPRNVASARVLNKIGMTYEGRLREVTLIRDGWRDSDMFSILRHEWSPRMTT